jgi:hypothetical protein
MHLELQFTQNVENGAQRDLGQDALEVVTQDSGLEVRNLRASAEPRVWQVALPTIDVDAETIDYDSVLSLWGTSARGSFRGLHSFNFHCFVDDAVYRVRFASSLQITAPAGHLRHIDTFTIRETLETSPTNTVAPAITGTRTVGNVLTVSNGTWTGSPTSYAYQWTRDGVDIALATAATHTLVSGDVGHMIGAYVTATDANGGQTRAWAADVGPIA